MFGKMRLFKLGHSCVVLLSNAPMAALTHHTCCVTALMVISPSGSLNPALQTLEFYGYIAGYELSVILIFVF